ncbi:NAD-dependent epimerase/dehydratase family protein [Lacisediminimonas profundi]|uniref:NAD-dependent epimerase/dehydratase family protein n=1 Tax=Lacisediminimonas profundi TaxID=2603856 RepID=UPI001386A104|nr:NAD(P)-dependent oxidoreductase [Lacisediminimonas profundi]
MQFPPPVPTIAVSGASGYLGTRLISALVSEGGYRVRALRHRAAAAHDACVDELQGNLLQPETLPPWLAPGCTVVHLAYMWHASPEENIRATSNLVDACASAGVARLVHVSTAAVIGRAATSWVDEKTPCSPTTPYGRTKLRIEEVIHEGARRHGFDLVVVRPTSVYGPGGAPLMKLCHDLQHARWQKNYLKSCLFGRRAMNLVHIDNVVAALRFLIGQAQSLDGATCIVSEDADRANNFLDVEQVIRNTLGLPAYPVPIMALPPAVLAATLRVMGRNIVDPRCRFSQATIESLGFSPVRSFADGLANFLDWYRKEMSADKRSNAQPGTANG